MACVNDGAATPRYCLPDFINALVAMDDDGGLFDLLNKDPFNEEEAAAVTKTLDDKVCIPCIEKLFDYMYMSFEDASDDDKYLRTFMDAACSSAPNDDNEDMYCMPILKYMEDDGEDDWTKAGADGLLDSENPTYDAAKVKFHVLHAVVTASFISLCFSPLH